MPTADPTLLLYIHYVNTTDGYTWDENKAWQSVRPHGIAFEDAIKIFDGSTLEQLDTRFDYSEDRWYAIGLVGGRPVTVIYTDVDEQTRRIISAWKAEKHEQKAFFDYLDPED